MPQRHWRSGRLRSGNRGQQISVCDAPQSFAVRVLDSTNYSRLGTQGAFASVDATGGEYDSVALPVEMYNSKNALRNLALFRDVGDDELDGLAIASCLRRIEKKRRVRNNDAKNDFAMIVRGMAKRTVPRGRAEGELVLDLIGDGEMVSESCLLGIQQAFAGETVALEASQVLFIPRAAFVRFLERHSAVAVLVLEILAVRLSRASTLAAQNACLEAGDRLYCRLVELAVFCGTVSREGLLVEHGLTQQELAGFSAASREIVNRQLAEWRERTWVETRRRSILIRDPHALTQSVSPAARGVGFGAGDGRNAFRTA